MIEAQGQGLCKACLDLLKEVAPDEARNYRKLSLLDRLQGNNCPCKEELNRTFAGSVFLSPGNNLAAICQPL